MGLFLKGQDSPDQTGLPSPQTPACSPGLDPPGETHHQPSLQSSPPRLDTEDPQPFKKNIELQHLQAGDKVGQSLFDDGDLAESMHLVVSLERSLSSQEEQRQLSLSQAKDTVIPFSENKNPVLVVPVAATSAPEASDEPMDPSMEHDPTPDPGESSNSLGQHMQPNKSCSSEQELSKLIQESLLYERLLGIELPANLSTHQEEECAVNLDVKLLEETDASGQKFITEAKSICEAPIVTLNDPNGSLDAIKIPASINGGEEKSVSCEFPREIRVQTSALVHDQSSTSISAGRSISKEPLVTSIHGPVSPADSRLQTHSLAAPDVESQPRIRKLSFKNIFGPLKRKDA